MAASPGGGAGAAYVLLKPVVRALVHQARATAASTKATSVHNQLKQLPRSAHYVKHTSFNLRQQVRRLVRSAWEGISRPIPSGGVARRAVAYPSSTTNIASRTPISSGQTSSLLDQYAQVIANAFTRASASFPRGASMTAQLGIRPSPAQSFAYARLPGGSSSSGFGTGAAGRARAMQATARAGKQSSSGGRNYSSHAGSKVLREISNVPIGMRALAERLREGDEKVAASKSFAGKPYSREEKTGAAGATVKAKPINGRRTGTPKAKDFAELSPATKAQSFEQYFPFVSSTTGGYKASTEDANKDTYLLIPLSPSLGEIMTSSTSRHSARLVEDPGPSASFLPTQTTIPPRLPNILKDLFPIHAAFSTHADQRVLPLLARLSGKGVFDAHIRSGDGKAVVEVIFGPDEDGAGDRRPEALRLNFEGVGECRVRELVGGLGEAGGARTWYHIYSVPRAQFDRQSRVSDSVHPSTTGMSSPRMPTSRWQSSELVAQHTHAPEENVWSMPIPDSFGAAENLPPTIDPELGSSALDASTEVSSISAASGIFSSPSNSSIGSSSSSNLDSRFLSSSEFDFEFDDDFSVRLDGRISPSLGSETGGEPIRSAALDGHTDYPDWTDAELEFEDEREMSRSRSSFGSDAELDELGEEEERVWALMDLRSPVGPGVQEVGEGTAVRGGPGLYLL